MNLEDVFTINELVRFSKSDSVLHPAYMPISKRKLWLDASLGLHPIPHDWREAILMALFFFKVRKYSIIEREAISFFFFFFSKEREAFTAKKPLTELFKRKWLHYSPKESDYTIGFWLVFLLRTDWLFYWECVVLFFCFAITLIVTLIPWS